ncbi:bifunctional tetrahydrofolate synthase/dihydrofolate synthase [Actinoalloteichus hymeniacidonis]|uniref:Dihydrofolate synthase/folylpolyglutamate synthase n=1 Tax=Actinoalloteichus hymeniacidonis TaxID=340345 RepID=A0AAC9HP69_9PSEU|nr:folylpolyglutamate synthase/dihydrofolate synthase family protein [Actinoalloteichus hymeniacidonis]AOS62436.1 folylpolyglutamate synthase/dihydrofolate synthase [Actinoalloteichus hymeniacidonis]MBB5909533.1 dihydrofolate synthase/folylpolyglutamate synthase [Actinoalloteichus hymeniacidonis]
MSGTESDAVQALREVEEELDTRWQESTIAPSLDRISVLADLLGSPQHAYPVLHVGGTNGKSSTVRMIDALLGRIGLRTGRFTSPHLQTVTERIALDGAPISPERYVEVYRDIEPYISMVDGQGEIRMTKFEVLAGMAFAAFADAPVEAAVIEVGLGGGWDATNVVDGRVSVVTPIALDHVEYLGSDILGIANEKAGIIKPGSTAVLAAQSPEVTRVLLERCIEVDASVARENEEFGVLDRTVAVGGQLLRLQGLGGVYEDVFLPLHGAHQARNAAIALASVEAFFGAGRERMLDIDVIREGFAEVRSPGRLEPVRAAPTVLVDAAHNPHGAAALRAAITSEFAFDRLVAVVSVLGDKDAAGILTELGAVADHLVITQNTSPRALPAETLGEMAIALFGEAKVTVKPALGEALETAMRMSGETDDPDEPAAGRGVVVTGSVITAGEARHFFGKEPG